jgi:hypothetical protein
MTSAETKMSYIEQKLGELKENMHETNRNGGGGGK